MKDLIPVIRFEGFEGEWKKVKLGDIGSWSKGKLLSKDDISENGKYKCIHYGELFKLYNEIVYQVFSRTDLNNACLSQIGDILFPDSDVTPTGLARCSSIMAAGVILGGGILILRPLPQYYSPFISLSVNNEKRQIISRITGTSVRHINSTALSEIEITCSNDIAEQQSISNYFTKLDEELTLQTQKLSKLKQIKAASLQNMFPQEGQMLPKVRFAGFGGEWERVRLGEMFDRLKHNSLSRAELCDEGEIANIHYGDVLIHYGECIDTTKDNLTYIKDEKLGNSLLQVGALRKGDVIFADAAEDNTVGKCSELICNESEQIVSGLHTIACRPLFPFAERYLGYCLNSPSYHNQLLPLIQGTKVSSISFKSLSQTLLLYPHDYKEQQAIANYFTKLDRKIELQTQKLEKLKQIKAACLSKMFV